MCSEGRDALLKFVEGNNIITSGKAMSPEQVAKNKALIEQHFINTPDGTE